jgi:glycosyltransferase involved in cell wall biosynthesis
MQSEISKEKISAIIPTRKGHTTIVRAIRSILNQTLQPDEIIIVSDHLLNVEDDKKNADLLQNTIEANFSNELNTGKIRIIDGQARGPGIARNLGVSHAKGDLIAFLDDDDMWADLTKLEKQVAYLSAHPDIDVVGTETTFFIRENTERFQTITQPIHPKDVHNQMLLRNPLITSSVLMRKKAFIEAHGFKTMYLAEDYDLWLRINRTGNGNRISNVPGTYIEYTVRSGSASQKKKIRMAWTVFLLVFKNMLFYPNRFAIVTTKWPVFKRLLTEKLR